MVSDHACTCRMEQLSLCKNFAKCWLVTNILLVTSSRVHCNFGECSPTLQDCNKMIPSSMKSLQCKAWAALVYSCVWHTALVCVTWHTALECLLHKHKLHWLTALQCYINQCLTQTVLAILAAMSPAQWENSAGHCHLRLFKFNFWMGHYWAMFMLNSKLKRVPKVTIKTWNPNVYNCIKLWI